MYTHGSLHSALLPYDAHNVQLCKQSVQLMHTYFSNTSHDAWDMQAVLIVIGFI